MPWGEKGLRRRVVVFLGVTWDVRRLCVCAAVLLAEERLGDGLVVYSCLSVLNMYGIVRLTVQLHRSLPSTL